MGCHIGGARGGGAPHGEPIGAPGAPITGVPTDPGGAPIEPGGAPMPGGAPIEPGGAPTGPAGVPIGPGGPPIDPGPAIGMPGALPHDIVVFRRVTGVTTSSSSAARALDPNGCLSGEGDLSRSLSSRTRPLADVGGPIGRAIALGMSVVEPRRTCAATWGAVGLASSARGNPPKSGGAGGVPLIDPGNIRGTSWAAGSRPGAPGGGGGVKPIPG